MIYIYRRASSSSARELVNGLMEVGTPARRWSAIHQREPRANDRVVCWGDPFNSGSHVLTLNATPMQDKYRDAIRLREANVATIDVSLSQPPPTASTLDIRGGAYTRLELRQLWEGSQAFLDSTDATWLARRFNHIGGSDLLHPGRADYYSRKESLDEEYRLHIFRGKSIRAGVKRPRSESQAHPWIRSYDGGWSINYDGFRSDKPLRQIARAAVTGLGLDFGAVDVARKTDGSLIVLEVNRAPGLEGGTVDAYVAAIQRWIAGDPE